MNMEDAVLIAPDFHVPKEGGPATRHSSDSRISLFGVFDGHGGRCVSRYVAKHFPSQFRAVWKEYTMSSSDFPSVLTKAFLDLDEQIKEQSSSKELIRMEREGERHEAEMQNNQHEEEEEEEEEQQQEEGEQEVHGDVDLETLAAMQHLSEEQKKALFVQIMMKHANNNDDDNNDDNLDDESCDSEEGEEEEEGNDDDETNGNNNNNNNNDDLYNHPAFHCGCTAVVAALVMKNGLSTLYVANAGDSRCVLSRNGIAAEMSKDHKPTDPEERARIVNAGGFVTNEGRIDGNLNLSRSFGDFNMKDNSKFGAKRQKVTVYPDVRMVPLVPDEDEFFVIASDGLWEVMTSQQAITFVSEKLKAGKMTLREIAEALCDTCLSSDPDTTDCYGCDNMSVVIVKLDNLPKLPTPPCTPTRKRRQVLMQSPRILRPRLVSPKDDADNNNKGSDEKLVVGDDSKKRPKKE